MRIRIYTKIEYFKEKLRRATICIVSYCGTIYKKLSQVKKVLKHCQVRKSDLFASLTIKTDKVIYA